MEQPSESSESWVPAALSKQVGPGLMTAGIAVSPETPARALPDVMAANRNCQTIAVVDSGGSLAGIIPVDMVVQALLLRVLPEEFLAEVREPERAAELMKEQHARTAGELMHPPVAVAIGATVREAFHLIHHAGLKGLPVVDEGGRVSGYVDLLQLLLSLQEDLSPHPASS